MNNDESIETTTADTATRRERPTLTISRDVADLVIDNNGTLDDLRGAAVRLGARLIALYNTPDKTTLSREVLAQADVYDGMRCAEEFAASRHLFDYVVWVDAAAYRCIKRKRSI